MIKLSPVATALKHLNESIYFIPKEVKDYLTNPKNDAIAYIKPWKSHPVTWFVFEAPKGIIEHYQDEYNIQVTHLFVSSKFSSSDVKSNSLFNYYVGSYDPKNGRWRWLDPDKETPKMTSSHNAVVLNDFSAREEKSSAWFF